MYIRSLYDPELFEGLLFIDPTQPAARGSTKPTNNSGISFRFVAYTRVSDDIDMSIKPRHHVWRYTHCEQNCTATRA